MTSGRRIRGVWGAGLLALAVLLALTGWLAGDRTAEAHAILVRSSPAIGEELPQAPATIDLWFSEPLEPQFSTFELLNARGETLPVDGIRVDTADQYRLSGLPRLIGPGLYTVVYRNVSRSDGHEWNGSFSFTVLNPDGSTPTGTAYQPELGASNSPANIVGRWLTFAGFALLTGSVVPPVLLYRRRRDTPRLWATSLGVYRRVALIGLPLVLAGAILVILAQAEAIRGASVLDVVGQTRGGRLWAWRLLTVEAAVVLVALAFLAQRWRRRRGAIATLVLLPIVGAAGQLTISLLSHAAAAPGSTWSIAADFAHLLLAALWLGGLAMLGVLLFVLRRGHAEDRAAAMVDVVAPFSALAAVGVYLLAVTGVIRTLGEVPAWAALWETDYGQWLLAKLVLTSGILVIAYMNRRAVQQVRRHRSRRSIQDAADRVSRLLMMEATFGLAILFTVAILGQTPTPRGSEPPPNLVAQHASFSGLQQADDLTMHLQVTPAVVGDNVLQLHVFETDGSEAAGIERVRITFARAGALGGEFLDATPQGSGVFSATGRFLSLALTWHLTVDVSRAGRDDARVEYAVPIAAAAQDSGDTSLSSPAPQLSGQMLAAVLALMGGIGLAILGWRQRHAWAQLGGWVTIFAALWLGSTSTSPVSLTNPTPGDAEAIARGAAVFAASCATCHGDDGRGDGPSAAGLVPRPVDLRIHVPMHPDANLFRFVSDGVPGTAMPAWSDQLTEQQRWDVVNYLRDQFDGP